MKHGTQKHSVLRIAVMQSIESRLLLAAELVLDAAPGTFDANPASLTTVGDTLYFGAFHPDSGIELYKSDGTSQGTTLVKDINPLFKENYNIWPRYLSNVNGTLFFAGDDGQHGMGLYKSNGTAAGTVRIKDVPLYEYAGKPTACFSASKSIASEARSPRLRCVSANRIALIDTFSIVSG